MSSLETIYSNSDLERDPRILKFVVSIVKTNGVLITDIQRASKYWGIETARQLEAIGIFASDFVNVNGREERMVYAVRSTKLMLPYLERVLAQKNDARLIDSKSFISSED